MLIREKKFSFDKLKIIIVQPFIDEGASYGEEECSFQIQIHAGIGENRGKISLQKYDLRTEWLSVEEADEWNQKLAKGIKKAREISRDLLMPTVTKEIYLPAAEFMKRQKLEAERKRKQDENYKLRRQKRLEQWRREGRLKYLR